MSTGYLLVFGWLILSSVITAVGILAENKTVIGIGAAMLLMLAMVAGIS